MNYLDLFSGIGGFALGSKWAGVEFDKHYFSEIDHYAVKAYKMRFPGSKNLGDIKYVKYNKLPKGEWFVTGGFPCQPHSVAGKKQADKDERDLWPECRRMLCELRPRAALFENVPGLFASNGGRFFNGILSDIYKCGYDAEWQVISAAEIGAPHLRKRVWIVCYQNYERGGGNHYWRTPDANMERGNRSYDNMKMRLEKGKPLNLNGNNNEIGSSPKSGDGLATAVKKSLWGTPTANDAKNTLMESQRGRGTLTAHIVETEGKQDGQLNPDWVEALMGYPIGWTDVSKGAITEIDYFEAWGNGTWENGLSPVTSGKKYRISRLKCLGNAVVPEIPAIIIQQIVRALWLQ